MKYINKFKTTESFEAVKEQLQELEHYVALTKDNNLVHLKPMSLPNILVITTNNSGTTINVVCMDTMFSGCTSLTSLDLSNFDTSNVDTMTDMFKGCDKLTHIKCKQAFKNWCITNQDTIKLPTAMHDNGEGQWEIVG